MILYGCWDVLIIPMVPMIFVQKMSHFHRGRGNAAEAVEIGVDLQSFEPVPLTLDLPGFTPGTSKMDKSRINQG